MDEKVAFIDLDGICFDTTERFACARKENGRIDFAIALDPAYYAAAVKRIETIVVPYDAAGV